MPEENLKALCQLGNTFQVEALGQGDPDAGCNLLAAMAATLANLAPTDGTILTKDGRPARLGMNLLVTGSASAGLCTDEVLTEVGRCQNNFTQQMRRYAEGIEEQHRKQGTPPPMGESSGESDQALAETQDDTGPLMGGRIDSWSRALGSAPPEDMRHLIAQPKFLVSAARPGDLEGQLKGLRRGNPLISVACSGPKDFANLAEVGASLIAGTYPMGSGGVLVRGNFLLSDPMGMLQQAAKAPDERTAWLSHFLWLCDGEAGPEAPVSSSSPKYRETVTQRFREALWRILALRMNLSEKERQPIQLAMDTSEAKVRFSAFLRDMESRLPGISGAARHLIDSLAFGLGEMASLGKKLPLKIEDVEALARFLVKRMANARTMILYSGEVARRRSQIERVFRKLQQGPAAPRKIYRNLSLSVGDCDECLRWLQLAGLACLVEGHWGLVEGARLNFDACNTPLLEVWGNEF